MTSIKLPNRTLAILACLAVPVGCTASEVPEVGRSAQAVTGQPLVINECSAGSGGWIEIYNTGIAAVDLATDPSNCWYVDDTSGGGAPKRIVDGNVNHVGSSTTCATAGRPASCAIVAPGEHVWVPYSYVNSTTADECRLLSSTKSGSTCSTSYVDEGVGGPTSSKVAGDCFGRYPEGGAWASGSLVCTQGASNGGTTPSCTVGAACDDANACTIGETYDSTCACTGGSSLSCDDGNACTLDTCAASTGCAHTNVADGTTCATDSTCVSGVCTLTPPPPPPPPPPAPGTDAVLVKKGVEGKVLLQGVVVTPDVFFTGEVLVESDVVTCVATSCSTMPGAATASIVQTNGIIFPGLIDTHNHILFDIFDESDWAPTKSYTNHNQWTSDARYKAMVDAKQYLNGESGSGVSIGCEMDKYGELKGLIAGTTSIAGAANPSDKICYGSLARTIDQKPNDLGVDKTQVATIFPSRSTADAICSNIGTGKTDAFIIHLGEGVDASALSEFDKLTNITTTPGCLDAPQTMLIHGTAFGDLQFTSMATNGMSLVWSPRSNVFLYGAGTDLTKTANIPLAISKGINVSLGPDWSIGGSQNVLDELRFADKVDNTVWGDVITPKMLVQMVTINAAKSLKLDAMLGSIAVGKKADLMVIGGDATKPYDALLAATPATVRLVLVNGVPLYGDSALKALGPSTPGCEDLGVCTASKFVCVAEPGGTSSDKLGQTLGDITSALSTQLASYDALGLTAWTFSPIAPLVKCP